MITMTTMLCVSFVYSAPFTTSLCVDAVSLTQACTLLGVDPETLTACGYSESQAFSLLDRLRNAIVERQEAAAAQASLQLAITRLSEWEQCDPGSDVSAIESARQDVASARAAVEVARQLLWDVLVQGEPAERVVMLNAWRGNGTSALPPEFRVVTWSASEQAMLERAIAAEKRAAVTGGVIPSRFSAILAAARARPEVTQAVAWRRVRYESVQSAFQTCLDEM